MLVVDFDAPSNFRALARFDDEAVEARRSPRAAKATCSARAISPSRSRPGGLSSRYQGVVALEGQGLETRRARLFRALRTDPDARAARGRAERDAGGSAMARRRPARAVPARLPERRRQADLHPGDAPEGVERRSPRPRTTIGSRRSSRAATTEDHELIDPTLSSERLLFRLFQRTRRARLRADAARRGLPLFGRAHRRDAAELLGGRAPAMIGDDGMIGVTCEFCSVKRVFDPADYGE